MGLSPVIIIVKKMYYSGAFVYGLRYPAYSVSFLVEGIGAICVEGAGEHTFSDLEGAFVDRVCISPIRQSRREGCRNIVICYINYHRPFTSTADLNNSFVVIYVQSLRL